MLKKLVTILMIMLFGFSSSGATVQLHYCCGKLKEVTWGSIQEKSCGMESMMDSRKCCETKSVSASDQEHELYTISLGTKAPVEETEIFSPQINPVTPATFFSDPASLSVPPLSERLFILHCVFRI